MNKLKLAIALLIMMLANTNKNFAQQVKTKVKRSSR